MRTLASFALAAVVLASSGVAAGDPKKKTEPPKKATQAPVPAPAGSTGVIVVETSGQPSSDYEAETYSGVPLDSPYAKERGVSKGLVFMVFQKERRAAFRVPRERIKKLVRFIADDVAPVMIVKAAPMSRTKIDVLETEDGVVAVETVSANAGIFTSSDVYVFARGATLEQRGAALAGVAPATRERIRRAMGMAQGAKP